MNTKRIKCLAFFLFGFFSLVLSQSYQELEKLKTEYKDALERQSLQKPKDVSDAEKTASSTALPNKLIYSRKDI